MATEVVYYHPEHFVEAGQFKPSHHLDLRVDGEFAGFLKFTYRTDPIPHYYIDYMIILPDYRGPKNLLKLMKAGSEFLRVKNGVGLAKDLVKDPNKRSLYERFGWERIEGFPKWFSFNAPDDISPRIWTRAIVKNSEQVKRSFLNFTPQVTL